MRKSTNNRVWFLTDFIDLLLQYCSQCLGDPG